jgi:hypothetical protein
MSAAEPRPRQPALTPEQSRDRHLTARPGVDCRRG